MGERLYKFKSTWAELVAHEHELSGKRLRVSIVRGKRAVTSKRATNKPKRGSSTPTALLKYADTWWGDDIEACMKAVGSCLMWFETCGSGRKSVGSSCSSRGGLRCEVIVT